MNLYIYIYIYIYIYSYSYFASNRISSNRLSSSHGGGVGLLIRNTFKISSYKCIPFWLWSDCFHKKWYLFI